MRLTEWFGRRLRQRPHGKPTHLANGAARGGSRPRTRPGPLQRDYDDAAVPALMRRGGFDFEAGLPARMQRAGTLAQIIVRMRGCYDSNDRTGFDKLVGQHDSLFADLDDKTDDLSAMGRTNREVCFPAMTEGIDQT